MIRTVIALAAATALTTLGAVPSSAVTPASSVAEITTTVPVDPGPTAVAFTPDGRTIYATSASGSDSVSVIDIDSGAVTKTIPVGASPAAVAFTVSPKGSSTVVAYVVNAGAGSVSVIDVADGQTVATIPVGRAPSSVAFSVDGTIAYVTNRDDNTVSVIDVAEGKTVGDPIDVGAAPSSVAFSPDGTVAFVASYTNSQVSVIDVESATVDRGFGVGSGPRSVVFSANGSVALTANENAATVSVITVADGTVSNIAAGVIPSSAAISLDGTRAYVADSYSSAVSVIDIASGTTTANLPVGSEPVSVAISPNGAVLATANSNASSVSVVVVVPAAPVFVDASPPSFGTIGSAFSYTFTATGIPTPTFAVTSGSLPVGLILSPDGSLSGTPTEGGLWNYEVTATNDVLPDAVSASFSLAINPPATPVGSAPMSVAFSPDGMMAYTADQDGYVSVIDVATGSAPAPPAPSRIFLGDSLSAVAFSPTEPIAYAANRSAGQVFVIDVPSGDVTTIDVEDEPMSVVFSRDGTRAYVANSASGSISVIDVARSTVSTTISGFSGLSAAAVSPDGRTLYATNSTHNTVSLVDISDPTLPVFGTPVAVGSRPSSVAFAPDGTTAYVTNAGDNTVSVIDVDASTTTGSPIAVGGNPVSVSFDPFGTVAYVANKDDNTVSVIDVATGTTGIPVPVGAEPVSVAVSPDGSRLYTADFGADSVSTVLLDSPAPVLTAASPPAVGAVDSWYEYSFVATAVSPVQFSITAGSLPYGVQLSAEGVLFGTALVQGSFDYVVTAQNGVNPNVTSTSQNVSIGPAPTPVGESPLSVVFAPDGETVYTANAVDDTVSVIDVATGTTGTPIQGATDPNSLAMSSDGSTLYVANKFYDDVSVIDVRTGSVKTTIPVGGLPVSVAVSPDGFTVYAANYLDNTVSVINDLKPEQAISLGPPGPNIGPVSVAVSPDGGTVYAAKDDGSLSVIRQGVVTSTEALGRFLTSVAFSPDGTIAYVTGTSDANPNAIFVIDVATDTVSAVISVSHVQNAVTFSPDGDTAYAVSRNSPTVTVIDVATQTTRPSLPAGAYPMSVAVSPDGSTLAVANSSDNTVSLIVLQPAAPVFSASSPPRSALVGDGYSYTFRATGTPRITFAVTAGALPAGLTLSSAGELSGAPSQAGVFEYSVTASNGTGAPSTVALTLETSPAPAPPVFTSSTPPSSGKVGVAYSHTFVASGYPAPVFAVTGALPDGLTLTSEGVLSGTPTIAMDTTYTVTASNGVAPQASTGALTLAISSTPAAPVFASSSAPPTGTVGVAYSYTFAASGYPEPVFAVTGTLPTGLTLTSAGVLSGSPTASGSASFTVTASNGIDPQASTGSLTVTIEPAPAAPVFTSSTPPPTGTVGVAYSYTFVASGYPAPTFSVAGALPDGLTLTSEGVLSGTPTTEGDTTYTVTASNGVSPAPSRTLTLSIASAPAAPVFTSSTPPSTGTVDVAYSYTFVATGNPVPEFAVTGTLPDGLTLTSEGVLSGTPTAPGDASFAVTASNGVAPRAITGTLTVAIAPAPAAPVFTSSKPPPSGTVGTAYSFTFAASGYPAPVFALTGALPDGVTLSSEGVLSGTPRTAGDASFTVTASNGVDPQASTGALTVRIASAPAAPVFTSWTPPSTGTVDVAYSYTFVATGNPAPVFAATGTLPEGFTLTPEGVLSGTPTAPGDASFTVTASNGVAPQATTGTVTVAIAPAPAAPVFTSSSAPQTGTVGTAYSYAFVASGYPEPVFAVTGTLPDGLTLSSEGMLSGTPTAAGNASYTVTATNGVAPAATTASQTLSIEASAVPLPPAEPDPTASATSHPAESSDLATTGAEIGLPLVGAAILLLSGLILTRLRRRYHKGATDRLR